MMIKHPIPTIPFDPTKHVIQGREKYEGAHVFFTLESVVAAERRVETVIAAPAPIAAEPVLDPLPPVEQPAPAPPQQPSISPELAKALNAATARIGDLQNANASLQANNAALQARVEKLEDVVAVHTQNFASLMALARGGA